MRRQEQINRHEGVAWLIATILPFFFVLTATAQREIHSLNDGWKFHKGEHATAADSICDDSTDNDSKWTSVHLPHTWNTDAYVEKDYYRGTGWYRRQITIPQAWHGKQILKDTGT